MEYYEMIVTCQMKKDLYFTDVNESIVKYINRTLYFDDKLGKLHSKFREYKYYCFSGFFPIELDKYYKKNRLYIFRLRSWDKQFIYKLKKVLYKNKYGDFRVWTAEIIENKYKHINKLFTLTPTIITIEDRPWKKEDNIMDAITRLQANLEKKYKEYFNEELVIDNYFIDTLKMINRKPLAYKYKDISLLGNKFELIINEDEISQKLAFTALAAGLGEKNSSLGAGFCERR